MTGAGWRRWLRIAVVVAFVLAAVPFTAFVIIPQFAQSTLHEAAPQTASRPSPPAAASIPSPTPDPSGPQVLARGSLRQIDAVHYGSGEVQLIEVGGARFVRFQDVNIAAAPNLYVYLSDRRDGAPGNYVDLGPVKATKGSFNQEIATTADVNKVGSVVLWCRAFSVTVTYAPLQTGG